MTYLYATILMLVNLLGLFLTMLGMPGNWLIVLCTALLAWWRPGMFSRWTLVAIVVLALVGEVLEFLSGALGSKRAGGTKRGSWGAILGSFIGGFLGTGLIPIPLIGTLVGVGLGAFLGAAAFEFSGGHPVGLSLRSGQGAALGRVMGVLAKLMIGVVMWLIAAVAAFRP